MNNVFGGIFSTYYENLSLDKNSSEAIKSIKNFTVNGDLQGMSFLDAGCGGGLFSYVASQLMAKKITAFDFDAQMVESAKSIRKKENIKNWSILQGDILDKSFVEGLGTFDYVYCWGCVHHTGEMWKAIANIIKTVNMDGYIYFGIYNDAKSFGIWDDGRFGSSLFWKKIKKFLSRRSKITKLVVLKASYFIYKILSLSKSFTFRNFSDRSMNHSIAIKDWLFGHPYEYASVDEVINYMIDNGFTLKKLESNFGLRTNHYLFQKQESIT